MYFTALRLILQVFYLIAVAVLIWRGCAGLVWDDGRPAEDDVLGVIGFPKECRKARVSWYSWWRCRYRRWPEYNLPAMATGVFPAPMVGGGNGMNSAADGAFPNVCNGRAEFSYSVFCWDSRNIYKCNCGRSRWIWGAFWDCRHAREPTSGLRPDVLRSRLIGRSNQEWQW